jgi:ActR/RegA family two-component response regulator
MHRQSGRKQILFVDDEESIRLTLPPVLENNGFEVRVAPSVPDALFEINSHTFDALLCDLNISEEGDGFLVVSAMRHVQPDSINLILTGYPALETALLAIRNQVDDYLVKPVDLDVVIGTIREKLENRKARSPASIKRLATVLQENMAVLSSRTVEAMKRDLKLAAIPLSDDQRSDSFARILTSLFKRVDLEDADWNLEAQRLALEYGRQRKNQGYTVANVVLDFQLLKQTIFDLMEKNLIVMELSGLVADLKKIESRMDFLIQKSLEPFAPAKGARASGK